MDDPYHAGEREIQERTGERHRALLNSRLMSAAIPPGALRFLEQQELVALGWRAPGDELWASVLGGGRGFARASEDRRTLQLEIDSDRGIAFDAMLSGPRPGAALATLFVDFATRRRLRVNGPLIERTPARLTIAVEQASPQCPKYIQRRAVRAEQGSAAVVDRVQPRTGTALTDELRAWLGAADTFFVASAHPSGALDVSHRGGAPGFVQVHDGLLRIPDYPGNSIFATLGNFALYPYAGLSFIDFAGARLLNMTGKVRLDLAAGERRGETAGAGRWWEFEPARWAVVPLDLRGVWAFLEYSPFNPAIAPPACPVEQA